MSAPPTENAEAVVVCHQIPVCAYPEVERLLYDNFAVVHDDPVLVRRKPEVAESLPPVDTEALCSAKLLLVRSQIGPGRREISALYPEVFSGPRFFTVLFVDEPLRLAALTHAQWVAETGESAAPKFKDHLEAMQNVQAAHLGADADTFESVLGRYDFVGVNTRKAETVARLGKRLVEVLEAGPRCPSAARALALLRRTAGAMPEVAPEPEVDKRLAQVGFFARRRFYRRNALDVAIYRSALRRFDAEGGR